MGLFWAMSLPGLVCALVVLAFVDQLALRARRSRWVPWRGTGREGQVSATGFEQLHAQFAAGKQAELEQRRTTLMLRDEEGEGAPPRSTVDLEGGVAVIRTGDPRSDDPTDAGASKPVADRSVGGGGGRS
ncbi:DUF6191 domain-containing protein [Kitasatospora cineracea]|uniref:DUF6191 domain-containing protein n=1 Tax=unclassified Kitasatospora TaxID=2633591 RepID=UPI0004C3344D|nr:DUF6191 domain-containing protein [Kitasatospora sp. YST-16]WNW38971.1 DUF6191 domain-containing protein [Streptomyces sp. Li-HN-5-13]